MAVTQAVVLIDHHSAQIQRLADSGSERVKEHASHTRQHGSNVRSEHDFFSDVCDALASIGETLVVGSRMAQADFRRYVEKHRPSLSPHLVGWETVDHPSPAQVMALARTFFERFDRMAGRPHSG